MPSSSTLMSEIDIDFTRAQGTGASGKISFQPSRVRAGETMMSRAEATVELRNGIGKVKLVRLPSGTYRAREEVDGKTPYEFHFALPPSSAGVIRYEEIAPVNPVPVVYTAVRTINDVAPNPTTGNIVVDVGGSDAHTHPISDVVGLTAALTELEVDIDGKAPLAHTHTVSEIQNFQGEVEAVAQDIVNLAVEERALPNRILRVKDKSKEGAGNTYNLPDTGSAWVLFAAGPTEYQIEANVGDDIQLDYDFQMDQHATAVMDFVVVNGGSTIVRYLGSGSSTPTYDGLPGIYPASERFQGISGMTGFTVAAEDIDAGHVRLRWAIKTAADNGQIYANNNSPLSIRVVNTRLSGL
jgi:hypothetical protein